MSTKPFSDIKAIRETQEAVRQQPELGHVTFNLKGQTQGGVALGTETGPLTQNEQADTSRAGQFKLRSDEPIALLGTNTGVSPAEYALQALAGCYAVTLSTLAAQRSIELDNLELDLNFDIDLNGFLGLDDSVRNGAKAIRVDVKLDSRTASHDELQQLVTALPQYSPLHDTFANPVDVSARLV